MIKRMLEAMDWPTCFFAGTLLSLGMLMVASSSLNIAGQHFHNPWHFFLHHLCFLTAGLVVGFGVCLVPIRLWRDMSSVLFFVGLVLLGLVLVPGLGRNVNGSIRWLHLGPLGFQVSELMKLFFIVYIADFLVRWQPSLEVEFKCFVKYMVIFSMVAVLLLAEPDFGSMVVILLSSGTMLFVVGSRLRYFLGGIAVAAVGLAGLIYAEPYRMKRLIAFLHPWQHQFSSGYQLTQSLIAFGQGGVWGRGLGHGLQKMFYLPEAHTDFLFAVLTEELGLVGAMVVLCLFFALIYRMFTIARLAFAKRAHYHGLIVYGIATWFALQAMINIGVNTGVLPTKGLTLPLMSYGGSSMMISCVALALVLRIYYEINHFSLAELKAFSVHPKRFFE